MKNELLHLGPFTVYGYGLMIALGILAGYAMAAYRAKKRSLDEDFLLTFALWAAGSGLLGAKLFFWLLNVNEIVRDPFFLVDTLSDGFVVVGGILLGMFCAWRVCKRRKEAFEVWFDLVMPSVALAQGFGRIGCFLAGCCYGKETTGAFCVVFPHSAYAPNGIPLIPTQPLSAALNFANAASCVFASSRVKQGQVAALYLINYSIGRFFLEFLRGDIERGFIGPLSTSQFVALFTLALGLGLWFRPRRA